MERIKPGYMLETFPRWLSDKREPKRIMYWLGHLQQDRMRLFGGQQITVLEVEMLARMVWGAYRRGQVYLTQERVGPNCFAYWAERRDAAPANVVAFKRRAV